MRRRGFTLVEILIGIILTSIVAVAIYNTLLGSQRLQRSLNSRMETQQSMRTAMMYLAGTLRELDALNGDLAAADADSVHYRANRWTAVSCRPVSVSGSQLTIAIRRRDAWGMLPPTQGRDSVFVYVEGDSTKRDDDRWVPGRLDAAPTDANCLRADGTENTADSAWTLQIGTSAGDATFAQTFFRRGAPLRGFQRERLFGVDSAGMRWVGRSTLGTNGTWSARELLFGPLQAGNGLVFTMFDSLDAATTQTNRAASVQIMMRAMSAELGWFGGTNRQHRDSLSTRVALRNNQRI